MKYLSLIIIIMYQIVLQSSDKIHCFKIKIGLLHRTTSIKSEHFPRKIAITKFANS